MVEPQVHLGRECINLLVKGYPGGGNAVIISVLDGIYKYTKQDLNFWFYLETFNESHLR